MEDVFRLESPHNAPKHRRKSGTPVFKQSHQGQVILFPPSLDELIPGNHPVRVINQVIEQLDITDLIREYKGGGASSFHPRMMIKAWVYGYFTGNNTSRTLARVLQENIHFMWLCGGQQPDFRTLNMFFQSRLKHQIDLIFKELTLYFTKTGQINLKQLFTDGTIVQANGNRHQAIWRKQVDREKLKLENKIEEKIAEIEQLNRAENARYGDKDLINPAPGNPEELKETIDRLKDKLKPPQPPDPSDTKRRKKIEKLERERAELEEKQQGYQAKSEVLNGRNSANKTDPDATYFRDKQGALVPAYNVQISTSDQFVVHYSVHQKAADTSCLPDHLKTMPEQLKEHLHSMVMDAGYGSEQNYELMEQMGLTAYVKYNMFQQDLKAGEVRLSIPTNTVWSIEHNTWLCNCQSLMTLTKVEEKLTAQGFVTYHHIYDCQACSNRISINHKLHRYKSTAFHLLTSKMGIQLRKKRNYDVETVFGNVKQNMKHRRLKSRTKSLVNVELGLIFTAHNFKKFINRLLESPQDGQGTLSGNTFSYSLNKNHHCPFTLNLKIAA